MAAAVVNPIDVVSSVLLDKQDLALECKSCLHLQSIVMSAFNASKWLEEVLGSVAAQTFAGSLELSVFDDASTVRKRTASVKLGMVLGVHSLAGQTLTWGVHLGCETRVLILSSLLVLLFSLLFSSKGLLSGDFEKVAATI